MRPTSLVLENFGSFRGRHEIDFTDVDLFVLAGPTGAGKSTVIDAITCALYGSVARYENANLVEPVINKMASQTKVSLTFRVGGVDHVATRVLRRTAAGGATAAEVRLERFAGDRHADVPPEALASGSREVLAAVTDLVGLTFDDFCKTVVLPQGAFAEFLHGQRDERQRLLVRLLGLERYEAVGRGARARAQALEMETERIGEELARLGDVTERDVVAAVDRHEQLEALRRDVVEDRWRRLEELKEAGTVAAAAAESVGARVAALAGVAVPGGVGAISERVRGADERLVAATRLRDERQSAAAQARAQLAAAGDPALMQEALRLDAELSAGRAGQRELREAVAVARRAVAAAEAALAEAEEAAVRARAAAEALRREHLAATLAAGVSAGDPCPVCRRTLGAVPDHPAPEGLEAKDAERVRAEELVRTRAAELRDQQARAARADASLEAVGERVAGLERELHRVRAAADLPARGGGEDLDRGAVEAGLAAARAAAQRAADADRAVTQAEAALRAASEERAGLDREHEAAWEAFTAARDAVTAYGAPPGDRTDLAAAWDGLVAWADSELTTARADLAAARESLDRARAGWRSEADAVADAVAAAGVELPDRAPQRVLDALAGAATGAARSAEELRERLTVVRERRERLRGAREEREVAATLGRLLRADQFPQWLLTRLSARLVSGASRTLDELTRGVFSLALDDRGSFQVIDHLNADERRPAKTLSGGETFLASLALALALADHVADVSGAGGARLEALFLDEGFGTLDPETLDTVASAIDELSGRRMVGVVTHVRELAARIPVCYEVQRGPDGSAVSMRSAGDEAADLPLPVAAGGEGAAP